MKHPKVDYNLAMNRAAMSMMQLKVDSHLKTLSPAEKEQFFQQIAEPQEVDVPSEEAAPEEKIHEGVVIE